MAATNFTPIILYNTATAALAPSDVNLADGELAINRLDEKLYFKNSAGTVKVLARTNLPAADVVNTPAGNIAATTVQAAINELDAEKVPRTAATGSGIIPVGTTAQRDGAPAAGYLRYNTSIASFEGYSGSAWGSVGGGATGAGGDTVFAENSLIVNNSYTLTAGKNAMSVGPITVASGQTVTIPSGSRWVVL